jgi:ribosome-associated protein
MWTDDPNYSLDDDSFDGNRPPSKSQLKRDSAALQDLGKDLLELPPEQLERLNLPPELLEAVRLGQSITAHGGLRRQRKFIGKLLRGLDPEPIRAGLAGLRLASAGAARLQRDCEHWRERMLTEGDAAVNEFLAEHPGADRQKLRQLVRDGNREREAGRPPRAARLLFRQLREAREPGQDQDAGGMEEAGED